MADQEVDPISASVLRRWRNAIIVAFALGGITMAALGARIPSIATALNAGPGTLGTILIGTTIGSLSGLVSASFVSLRWGARFGIRAALLIVAGGLGVIAAAVAAGAVVGTAIGLALMGYGIGLVDVLMNVEGSLVEAEAGKTLMPMFHASWSAGAIIGAGIGAGAAGLGIEVWWQFTGEAVVIAAAALIAARSIPLHAPPADAAADRPWGERARAVVANLADWRLVLIGVVMLGSELGEGSANNWMTLAVTTEHHRSESVAGAFFMLFAVGETVARLAGGPVVDRIGRVNAVRFTSAIGVAGVAVFILGTSGPVIMLGVIGWAIGVSMGFPLGMSAAADSGPNPAARVSVVAMIGYAANLAGPPALGNLAERVGLLNAMWVIAVLMVVAAVAAPALASTRSSTLASTNS